MIDFFRLRCLKEWGPIQAQRSVRQSVIGLEREDEEQAEGFPRATDRELIEQARGGSREAFGELVRQYRAEALGVANRMVRDPHMAEDVVQDALIRAFIHLGSLMDGGKFGPWLRRIVRNQALLKLRRGGPYAKEQPFSGRNGRRGRLFGFRRRRSFDGLDEHRPSAVPSADGGGARSAKSR